MADRTSTVRVVVDSDTTGASSKLRSFAGFAGKAALGVAALGVAGVVGATKLYAFGDAADDLNASIDQGLKTMGLFGDQFDEVGQRVQDHAKKVSLATAVDINSIKATQAKLLTFKQLAKTADVTGGAFDRATEAAVDLAAKGFGTAEANATALGKALNDPAESLSALTKTGVLTKEQVRQIGEEFKKTGDISAAQASVLAAVEAQVGGTAKAQAGGFELMTNKLKIFGQELAVKALPYMDRFGTFLAEKAGPAALQFARTMAEKLGPTLRSVAGFISDRVIPAASDLYTWFVEKIAPGIRDTVTPIIDGGRKAFEKIRGAFSDNSEELGDLQGALKKIYEVVYTKVMPIVGKFIGEGLEVLGTTIGTTIDVIAGIVTAFQNVYDKVTDAVGAVKDLIGWIGKIDLPDINIPGVGRISARGDLGKGPISSAVSSRGGDVYITVNVPGGFIGDEITLMRRIRDGLADDLRRLGATA